MSGIPISISKLTDHSVARSSCFRVFEGQRTLRTQWWIRFPALSIAVDHFRLSVQTSLGFQSHYPPQQQRSQRRPRSPPLSSRPPQLRLAKNRMRMNKPHTHRGCSRSSQSPKRQPQQSTSSASSAPVTSAPSAMTFTRPLTHREQELLAHLDRLTQTLHTLRSIGSFCQIKNTSPVSSGAVFITSQARISSGHSSSA